MKVRPMKVRMKVTLRATAVALGLALVATGCGGDNGDGDDTAGGDEGTTGIELKNLDGVSLEVAAKWTGVEEENFTNVLQAFEDKTGAEVTYTPTGENTEQFLAPRISAGEPPDIAILPQPGLVERYATDGALTPLSADVLSLVEENFSPYWKDLTTVDGQTYGVFYKAASKSTVWYRPQVFSDAGVEPPATWDDFLEVAQTISDFGVTPVSVGGGAGWVLTDWFENVYVSQAGPEMYDQLTAHEIPWTDPSVTEALTTLAELFDNDNLLVGGKDGAVGTSFEDSVTNVFAQDQAAMVYEGDFVAGFIRGNTDATVGEDALFFPFPAVGGGDPPQIVAGDTAVVMNDSEGAQELMKFLASAEAAEIWIAEGGLLSVNNQVNPDTYPDEISKELGTALLEAGDNVRFDMSDLAPAAFGATEAKGEWAALQNFLRNPSDVQGAQQVLESEAATAYGS